MDTTFKVTLVIKGDEETAKRALYRYLNTWFLRDWTNPPYPPESLLHFSVSSPEKAPESPVEGS